MLVCFLGAKDTHRTWQQLTQFMVQNPKDDVAWPPPFPAFGEPFEEPFIRHDLVILNPCATKLTFNLYI